MKQLIHLRLPDVKKIVTARYDQAIAWPGNLGNISETILTVMMIMKGKTLKTFAADTHPGALILPHGSLAFTDNLNCIPSKSLTWVPSQNLNLWVLSSKC